MPQSWRNHDRVQPEAGATLRTHQRRAIRSSNRLSSRLMRSAQKEGEPSRKTRTSQSVGGTKRRLVSAKRPSSIRSTQITKDGPKAARASGVGHTKSASAGTPTRTTWSQSHPILRACSIRSSGENPKSLLMLARTSSALNQTAPSMGARIFARVVLPAPGRPMTRIFFDTSLVSLRNSSTSRCSQDENFGNRPRQLDIEPSRLISGALSKI